MATLNLVGTGDTNWAAKQNANLTNINNELIATTAKANAAQVAADLDDDTAALAADSESALRTALNAAYVGLTGVGSRISDGNVATGRLLPATAAGASDTYPADAAIVAVVAVRTA